MGVPLCLIQMSPDILNINISVSADDFLKPQVCGGGFQFDLHCRTREGNITLCHAVSRIERVEHRAQDSQNEDSDPNEGGLPVCAHNWEYSV
jgi:hypothetical protein